MKFKNKYFVLIYENIKYQNNNKDLFLLLMKLIIDDLEKKLLLVYELFNKTVIIVLILVKLKFIEIQEKRYNNILSKFININKEIIKSKI